MAEVIKETHYHEDGDAPARGNSGMITAIVVILVILLALFFFSRGFGDGVGNNTTPSESSTPNVQVEGGVSGSASGTTGE